MEPGRVGVWLGALGLLPAAEERAAAAELEALGYGTLWFGEGPFNREALAHAGLLLAATERVVVATGIASIWLRSAVAAANGAAALAEAYPGRFALALGVSHAPLVERLGRDYRSPLSAMRAYLDAMDAAEYRAPAPPERPPRLLAALAPRMLELARERADGAHPYLVPPEHTRRAREALGPGKLLAPEQAFVLGGDRAPARAHVAGYLELPNYRNNLLRLGFEESDVAGGGSDRLVDALVACGDEQAVRARVEEHLAAGADHVALQAVGPDPLADLRRVADAVLAAG